MPSAYDIFGIRSDGTAIITSGSGYDRKFEYWKDTVAISQCIDNAARLRGAGDPAGRVSSGDFPDSLCPYGGVLGELCVHADRLRRRRGGVLAGLCKPDTKSRFYGFPIARIGVIYGAAQLVCGLAFMALGKWVPVWAAVLVYALGLGAAAIGLIAADTVAEEIQAQDVRLKVNVSFMRDLQSKVNRMAAQCDLAELRQLSEDIRYSDPVSSDALAEIERDLAAAVDDLQAAVVDGDWQAARTLCRNTSALLTERNRLCKLNK